jgi:hypothetical protein
VKGTTRWARLALPILACLLLVLVFAVLGCGGSSTSETTVSTAVGDSSGTTTSAAGGGGVKTYSNGQYSYSFQYPDTWEIEEGTSADVSAGGSAVASLGVYDPNGAVAQDTYIDMALVSIFKLKVTVDSSMMSQIKTEVESVLDSLKSQTPDIKTVEDLSETTVNGMSGYTVTFSLTKNGTPVTTTLYFLFSGNMEYQVTVQGSQENWDKLKPVFAAMIASFKPTAE